MELITRKNNGALIAAVKGRLDAVTAPEFDKMSKGWLESGDTRIIVDLNELEYMSSAGLRSVLILARLVKAADGKLFFTGLQGPVKGVFEMSGFYTILNIVDSESAALDKL